MSLPVSINEVARVAGVSKSTVSRVLAGRGKAARISPATHARVRAVSSQLGYQPNLIARDMALGRLQLGTWQSIYLAEFDGPRHREVWIE